MGNMGNMGQRDEAMPMHSHERCELHGGEVTMTSHNHFETTFEPDGIRVYLYSEDQNPMRVEKVTGTATVRLQDGTTKEVTLTEATPADGEPAVYFCASQPGIVQDHPGTCPGADGARLVEQDYLRGKMDLKSMAPGSMKAVVTLRNLGGEKGEETFTQTFRGFDTMLPMQQAQHASAMMPRKTEKTSGSSGY